MTSGIRAFNSSTEYSTRISGAPGVAREIKIVLNELAKGLTIGEVEKEVLEDNILDKSTLRSRDKVFSAMKLRYLNNPDVNLGVLTNLISSDVSERIKDLVLYYHFCNSERLVYDLTVELLYNNFQKGKLTVPKKEIVAFLESKVEKHPESEKWTPTIKQRIAEHYLASLKHFGVLKGSKIKEFNMDYVPLEVIMYVVFDLKDKEYTNKQIMNYEGFKVFFIDKSDLIRYLEEATRAGIIKFSYTKDIYEIDTLGKNLGGFVDEIRSKV